MGEMLDKIIGHEHQCEKCHGSGEVKADCDCGERKCPGYKYVRCYECNGSGKYRCHCGGGRMVKGDGSSTRRSIDIYGE